MVRRAVSHKVTFGANGLIRITIEFQMTGIDPYPANARNVWLAARNVAYKHALRVRGKRRPAQQNARTGHSNRQFGANRLSRGARKGRIRQFSAGYRPRYPHGNLIVAGFKVPGAGSISSRISNRLGLLPGKDSTAFTCRHTEQG